ncbi:ATP-binding protein [Agromyces sp. SYSU T00194]|uniref:ATP-binding protein n=1 Tax=Agromyces chitinivorans TaxID=3158560 RepID=UPI003394F376
MAAYFDVEAFGVPVRVDVDDSVPDASTRELRSQWRHALVSGRDPEVRLYYGVRPGTGDAVQTVVTRPARWLVGATTELAARVATDVTLGALEARAGDRLLFHSSAVALDDGGVIGFIGRSGMGKTTLVSTLARRYGYVTDETLCVDRDGAVAPYQKPLSIGRAPQIKTQRAAADLGMRIAPNAGLALAALVLLDRRDDAPAAEVHVVPLAEAVPAVAAHMSYFGRMPRPLRSICELVVRTGGVRRVSYRESESVLDRIAEILAIAPPPTPTLEDVEPYPGTPTREGYHRAPYSDALRIGDEVLILHGSRITRLNDLAAILWNSAAGLDLDALVERVSDGLGEAPEGIDARAVVGRNIGELIGAGLLVHQGA